MKALQAATRNAGFAAGSVFLASALTTSPAMADVVDITWDATGHFERSPTVAPGKFAEMCGKLPASLILRWEFESDAPMDFDVHTHSGNEVVFPAKLVAVAKGKDILRTKVEQDDGWVWSNKSTATIALTVRLDRCAWWFPC